jgi:hypothetical protein
MKRLPALALAAVLLPAPGVLIRSAQYDPSDPLEDSVTFRLTFEGTLKPVKASEEAGPRVVFMISAVKKERFQVKKDALDAKHFVKGLRGRGLTNADAKTFFEEIQYPAAGHIKSRSGTILWWMKFTRPAAARGGGKIFRTMDGSLFCALEATPQRDELEVVVVAQDQREKPPLRLAEVRGKISRKKGEWTQVGIRWNKKSVALLIDGEEAAIETLKRPFKAEQFADSFVLSLFAFVKEGDVAVLDEFTIYNRPLTAHELEREYQRFDEARR